MATGRPRFKVVLCGSYGVGKSALFQRFVNDTFTESRSGRTPSIGFDNYCKDFMVDGTTMQMELWDTAGLERFSSMSGSYYVDCSAVIVCFTLGDTDHSYQTIEQVLDAANYTNTGAAVLFLCGTKSDLCSDSVSVSVDKLTTQFDHLVLRSFAISSKSKHGTVDMFQTIATIVKNKESIKLNGRVNLRQQESIRSEKDHNECQC